MLERITLTNFKRHENLTVEFGAGLNAVKAGNEHGKSSLLHAVAYALFGAKALNDSLDDTVTWGQPVNSLKVDLTFSLHHTQYRITRSKASAELTYGDETVTGQVETAKFVADLLGADAALASKLLIASQSDVQGALSGGARGASELIERLADFQQLDELIELLQTCLTTGSPATLKDRLGRAEAVLSEMAQTPTITAQELDDWSQRAQQAQATADSLHASVKQAAVAHQQAQSALQQALQNQASQQAATTRVQERRAALSALSAQEPDMPEEGDTALAVRTATSDEDAARQLLTLAQSYEALQQINDALDAKWGKVGDPNNSRYEGSAADADEEMKETARSISERVSKVSTLNENIVRNKALMLSGECTACGLDLSDVENVRVRNAALQAEINEWSLALETERDRQETDTEYSQSMGAVIEANRITARALPAAKDRIRMADKTVPSQLEWIGDAPPTVAEARAGVDAARESLRLAQESATLHEHRKRAYADWQRRVKDAEAAVAAAAKQLADLGQTQALPADQLQAQASASRAAHESLLAEYEAAKSEASALSDSWREKKQALALAVQAREHAERELLVCRTDLKQLEFNNTLLKAVREARPTVTDRLWNLVLAAVSTYFSDMRGTPSAVTRAGGGFEVDGHPVSTLSGSTKDALGLAIRVALMRTFLPGLSLLILDEPNAAMDAERTAQVLGFIAGAGFEQVLIVSHDEMTVDVADHIITLETV